MKIFLFSKIYFLVKIYLSRFNTFYDKKYMIKVTKEIRMKMYEICFYYTSSLVNNFNLNTSLTAIHRDFNSFICKLFRNSDD